MKWIILVLSMIVACAPIDHSKTQNPLSIKPAADGPAVAAQLTAAYFDTRENCGTLSTPAFLCSGVLFRGTNQSAGHHAWNPNPGDIAVSFSYVRKDANFDHIAVGTVNGFIFYPYFNAPAGKVHPQILCSFPIDGYTWLRTECGPSSTYPVVSDVCQKQNITTATQWRAHLNNGPSGAQLESVYAYTCGFDVRNSLNEQGGPAFYQSLQAMHQIPSALRHKYNELLLQTWAQDIPTSLPIQAFFYLEGGLGRAQYDQDDFYNSSGGTVIPIIKMTLPPVVTGDAKFEYFPADQRYGG